MEISKALVSVIIPTYKRPNELIRAVNSVLNQTYNNTEIIIVDDNGKDTEFQIETEKSVYNNFSDEKKVKYLIKEKNSGLSDSRNTGVNIAKGKYVTFLDDDDEFDKNKIIEQLSLMNNYDVVYCAGLMMGTNKIIGFNDKISQVLISHIKKRLTPVGIGASLFIKKEIYGKGFDVDLVSFSEDLDMQINLIAKGYKVGFLNKPLYIVNFDSSEAQRITTSNLRLKPKELHNRTFAIRKNALILGKWYSNLGIAMIYLQYFHRRKNPLPYIKEAIVQTNIFIVFIAFIKFTLAKIKN